MGESDLMNTAEQTDSMDSCDATDADGCVDDAADETRPSAVEHPVGRKVAPRSGFSNAFSSYALRQGSMDSDAAIASTDHHGCISVTSGDSVSTTSAPQLGSQFSFADPLTSTGASSTCLEARFADRQTVGLESGSASCAIDAGLLSVSALSHTDSLPPFGRAVATPDRPSPYASGGEAHLSVTGASHASVGGPNDQTLLTSQLSVSPSVAGEASADRRGSLSHTSASAASYVIGSNGAEALERFPGVPLDSQASVPANYLSSTPYCPRARDDVEESADLLSFTADRVLPCAIDSAPLVGKESQHPSNIPDSVQASSKLALSAASGSSSRGEVNRMEDWMVKIMARGHSDLSHVGAMSIASCDGDRALSAPRPAHHEAPDLLAEALRGSQRLPEGQEGDDVAEMAMITQPFDSLQNTGRQNLDSFGVVAASGPTHVFCAGDDVHIWSNSQNAWMTDGFVEEVLSQPMVSDGMSVPVGVTVPIGAVKVTSNAGTKWVMPHLVASQLRKSCPHEYKKGSKVHVWSNSMKTWMEDGLITEVSHGPVQGGVEMPPAGAVKVVSRAGEKWVMPDQLDIQLRKAIAREDKISAETVAQVRPALSHFTAAPLTATRAAPAQPPSITPQAQSIRSIDQLGPTVMELPKNSVRLSTATSQLAPVAEMPLLMTPQAQTRHVDERTMHVVETAQSSVCYSAPISRASSFAADDMGPTVTSLPKRHLAPLGIRQPTTLSSGRTLHVVQEGAPAIASAYPVAGMPVQIASPAAVQNIGSAMGSNAQSPEVVQNKTPSGYSHVERPCMPAQPQLSLPLPASSAQSQSLEVSQRLSMASELQQRLMSARPNACYPAQGADVVKMPASLLGGLVESAQPVLDCMGMDTITGLPPPPRGAPAMQFRSSTSTSSSYLDNGNGNAQLQRNMLESAPACNETIGALPPPGRGTAPQSMSAPRISTPYGGGSSDGGQHVLHVLVREGRSEKLSFLAQSDLLQSATQFLQQYGVKATFASGLVQQMKQMIGSGQREESVDIVDLL